MDSQDFHYRVMAAMNTVLDPEIPVLSIVDLGMVRGIEENPPAVLLTPTYTGCPATHAIHAAVRRALDDGGLNAVGIRTVLSPPWTTEWNAPA